MPTVCSTSQTDVRFPWPFPLLVKPALRLCQLSTPTHIHTSPRGSHKLWDQWLKPAVTSFLLRAAGRSVLTIWSFLFLFLGINRYRICLIISGELTHKRINRSWTVFFGQNVRLYANVQSLRVCDFPKKSTKSIFLRHNHSNNRYFYHIVVDCSHAPVSDNCCFGTLWDKNE